MKRTAGERRADQLALLRPHQAEQMPFKVLCIAAGMHAAAAKVRRDGKFALYVDGNAVIENLDGVWNPTFSPDGTVLLFCSLKDGVFSRHTVRL